jgi:hypothetical protein
MPTEERREYMRDYMNTYYLIRPEKFNNSLRQYIVSSQLIHKNLTPEEMQEKINEYRLRYIANKQARHEKKLKDEEKRRQKFIYG